MTSGPNTCTVYDGVGGLGLPAGLPSPGHNHSKPVIAAAKRTLLPRFDQVVENIGSSPLLVCSTTEHKGHRCRRAH
jgi:hypothetical protein